MKINAGCKTCTGNTREINQDAVILRSMRQGGWYFVVLAVCDGIGGLEHGEVASSLTVQRINQWYDGIVQWLDLETADPGLMNAHLKDLAEECNRLVREYQEAHQINTGTTMSLLMIIRDCCYIVQIGDSRVYRYRDRLLHQITRDASVTRIKNGRVKQYLDNYLGKQDALWFTDWSGTLRKGDILLVCSDGLYHFLRQEDIWQLEKDIRKEKRLPAACEQMIERMMKRGERDNITVGLIAVV